MRDGKLAIDWVEVIPVRVDLFISNGDENVTLFDTGFCGRPVLVHLIDVNAAIGILELHIFAKLRIAGGGESNAGSRKALVGLVLGLYKKMLDDRTGDSVDSLRSTIVPHQECGQPVLFNDRQRKAIFTKLKRAAHSKHQITRIFKCILATSTLVTRVLVETGVPLASNCRTERSSPVFTSVVVCSGCMPSRNFGSGELSMARFAS